MIKHIKLENNKGLKKLFLENLGQTNIICGKNNSGKSSILESIVKNGSNSIGLEINSENETQWNNDILSRANGYSDPFRTSAKNWFENYLTNYIKNYPLWYQNDLAHIDDTFQTEMKNDPRTRNTNKVFDFEKIFGSIFIEPKKQFTPVLIPPKRHFQTITQINLNQDLFPNGEGLVNKLFFLKNHHLQSKEFITYKKIDKLFSDMTGYIFNIVPIHDNQLRLDFNIKGNVINADDCGLGLKDLLFLITFVLSTTNSCYLIEEPENHLHADFQKKLLSFFKESTDKQFIISTHSNIFIDPNLVDKIFYCWFDKEVKVSDTTSISKIIDSLGYSAIENLTADAIILTEGPTDIPILKKAFYLNKTIDNFNIKFWPLGGDIMGSSDLSIFSNTNKVFAIIDNDPGSLKVRNKFKANCKSNGIPCFQLKKYAIENYLPLSIIKNAHPDQIKIDILSENESVDVQIGFKAKDKSIKDKNTSMAEQLKKEDLEGTDLWDYVLKIEKKIKAQPPETK